MKNQNVDVDYCGVVYLLRELIRSGVCSQREAKRIADRIAKQLSVSVIISL
jgi:hypothetical protein